MSKIAPEDHDLKKEGVTVLEVTSDFEATREEPLNRKRNARKLLEPTDAFKLFQQSLSLVSLFGIFLGADTKYEWKCNPRFAITMFIIPFSWSQFFYTQFLYLYQGNIMRNLEVIALYGISVSYILKVKFFVKYFKNITALYKSTIKICKGVSGLRLEKLKTNLQASFTFYKYIAFVAIPSTIIYSFYPIKSYFFDGKFVPLLPMEIMFIDQSTQLGFLTANVVMAVVGIYTIAIIIYMVMNFIILATGNTIRADCVEIDFNELDALWSNTSTSTIAYRHMYLRNICRKFIDIRGYIDEFKIIFDEKLFVFFCFGYLSQILCLYEIRVVCFLSMITNLCAFNFRWGVILKLFINTWFNSQLRIDLYLEQDVDSMSVYLQNNWIPGYAVAFGTFFEMILYCLMGTRISIQNERLYSIITQSKWYTYDIHSQKIIISLLNVAMNSPELWIGPFAPLSVFTAIEIIKSIFSYYTIMVKLV